MYIRGYKEQKLSPTLKDALAWGSEIHYTNRELFKRMRTAPPKLAEDTFWIGEGALHELALKGAAESIMELPCQYDYILMATATGASLAGVSLGVAKQGWVRSMNESAVTQVIGVAVLKNANQLNHNVSLMLQTQLSEACLPAIQTGYEFGGYAKKDNELLTFIEEIERDYQVELEPVYSAKSFFAVLDMVRLDIFPEGSKVLLIHCGGLQGKRGFCANKSD